MNTNQKRTVLGTLLTLLLIAGGALWANRPDADLGTLADRPTPVTSPTATSRSRTATPATPTLVPTGVITPTITASPTLGGVTLTVTTTPLVMTPTKTPTPGGNVHNPTKWHKPSLDPGFRMTHGVNPNDYIPVFGPILQDYLNTYGEISYPWHTPEENSEIGYGHHTGYIWIYDQAENGCELFNNGGQLPVDTLNCVTDVLIVLHTDGTQAHVRKRFHSHYAFLRVCDQATKTKCRIYATGGWVDYGVLEVPYKGFWCKLPGIDPAYFTANPNEVSIDQPPYRTSHHEYRGDTTLLKDPDNFLWDQLDLKFLDTIPQATQFWSGLRPNASYQKAFDLNNGKTYPENMPNATLGVAWSSLDAWGIINQNTCSDPETDVIFDDTGHSALNNTAFQIFEIYLYQHPPAPSSGFAVYYTDRWGQILEEECVIVGVDCVPFYVGSGGVDGPALLNRQVAREAAPIHEFDVAGGGIIIPAPLFPGGFPGLPPIHGPLMFYECS